MKTLITTEDITKADALILQFCKRLEILYQGNSVTPNMHLHCHLQECIRDYGPIHSFWLFSFERYNGILGNYQTNNRSIEIQLMRRFKYENQNATPPDEFHDYSDVAQTIRPAQIQSPLPSTGYELLQTATCNLSTESNSHTWSTTNHIVPCSWSTTKGFDWEEQKVIYQVYATLYKEQQLQELQETPITFQKYLSVTIDGEVFHSVECKRTRRSPIIMASWAGTDGQINTESFHSRPGLVLLYFKHSISIDGKGTSHVMACVKWFSKSTENIEHSPLSCWKAQQFEKAGPSAFMPVQRIYTKCTALELQHRGSNLLVVCPMPRKDKV